MAIALTFSKLQIPSIYLNTWDMQTYLDFLDLYLKKSNSEETGKTLSTDEELEVF